MDTDRVLRRALRASVVFNLGGALLFGFPDSIGQLAGLPTPVPRVYSATLAMLVTLFAATYAWLARQPHIYRPLVTFFAFGKAGFFAVVFVCWLTGEVPALAVVGAVGDLAFAAIFAWWLVTTADAPGAAARSEGAAPAGFRKG